MKYRVRMERSVTFEITEIVEATDPIDATSKAIHQAGEGNLTDWDPLDFGRTTVKVNDVNEEKE